MALPATLRRFEIELADADRNVYEQIDWRVAQHPSESARYLVARVLARALEHGDGLEFAKGGVSDDEEPALIQRDLRGDVIAWIEIGAPSPERLHKASKASPRVAVYGWKQLDQLAREIVDQRVYRGDAIELYALPADQLDAIAGVLDRTNRWALAVTGHVAYLTIGSQLFEVPISRVARTAHED